MNGLLLFGALILGGAAGAFAIWSLLRTKTAVLQAALQQERQQEQQLKDAFKSLAADALNSNNQSFLDLAKTAFKAEQETAKGSFGELVTPVKTALTNVEKKIQDLEVARQGAYSGLLTEVKTLQESERLLRSETANLVSALRSPTVPRSLGRNATPPRGGNCRHARSLRFLRAS